MASLKNKWLKHWNNYCKLGMHRQSQYRYNWLIINTMCRGSTILFLVLTSCTTCRGSTILFLVLTSCTACRGSTALTSSTVCRGSTVLTSSTVCRGSHQQPAGCSLRQFCWGGARMLRCWELTAAVCCWCCRCWTPFVAVVVVMVKVAADGGEQRDLPFVTNYCIQLSIISSACPDASRWWNNMFLVSNI